MTTESASEQSAAGSRLPEIPLRYRLAAMVLLAVGVLWALPHQRTHGGKPDSLLWSVAFGSSLVGAALCALGASQRQTEANRSRSGWVLLNLSLLALAVAGCMRYDVDTTLHGPVSGFVGTLASGFLVAQAALLWAALLVGTQATENRSPAGGRLGLGIDSLVLGGSCWALLWWWKVEPVVRAAGPQAVHRLNWGECLAALINTIALIAVVIDNRQDESDRFSPVVLAAGTAFLAVAGYRSFWFAAGDLPGATDVAVLAVGPLLLGTVALNAWNGARIRHNSGEDLPPAKPQRRKESTPDEASIIARPIASLLTVGLPCIVVIVGTLHLNSPDYRVETAPLLPLEAWWGPILAALAAVSYALAIWQSTRSIYNSHSFGHSRINEVERLRHELAKRTHQLSTLHAVTADLNDTLDCEAVLTTALERMIDAVSADAGAVWLRVDIGNLEGPDQRQEGHGLASGSPVLSSTNTAFLLREIERGESERRSLASLKGNVNAGFSNNSLTMGRRWRLVRARGDELGNPRAGAHSACLRGMHTALEDGGLDRCNAVCASKPEIFGFAHTAHIRWKGEVLGALSVMRWREEMEDAERSLLDALALEVGSAIQNAQLYQEASRLADRDALTDLLNHRAIQQQLNATLSRARRLSGEFAVIMMDLNNFKFFNDTYGHPVGDQVLLTVAACLRDACRVSDVLGRFGGDEFIALLLDTDVAGALHVCTRIAERVEEEAYTHANDGRRIPIGLSFGAAIYPQDGDTAMELLTVADANLYEAKRGGAPLNIQRNPTEESLELRKLKDTGVGGSFGVLDALVTAIDNKDHYTRRHSEDVTHWATMMARELNYSPEVQRAVRISGLLHDVGKIAVPDSILRKPGRLNDEEFNIMQQHPVFGALIIKDVPNLTEVLGGIRHHHERFDGKGYPDKLTGENIPVLGRVLAVPDCFSAMTTERPYRKALTWQEAITEISKGSGTQFDPVMADAFLEVIAKIVDEQNATSLDKDGTRQQVVQIGTPSAAANAAAAGLKPRSVADAETIAA